MVPAVIGFNFKPSLHPEKTLEPWTAISACMTLPMMFGVGVWSLILMSPQMNIDPDWFILGLLRKKKVNIHCDQDGICSNDQQPRGVSRTTLKLWEVPRIDLGLVGAFVHGDFWVAECFFNSPCYPKKSSNHNIPNDATHGANAIWWTILRMGSEVNHTSNCKHLQTTCILFGRVSKCGLPVYGSNTWWGKSVR